MLWGGCLNPIKGFVHRASVIRISGISGKVALVDSKFACGFL